jgi:hypothetical protein
MYPCLPYDAIGPALKLGMIDSEPIATRPLTIAPETAPELEASATSYIRIIFPRFAGET